MMELHPLAKNYFYFQSSSDIKILDSHLKISWRSTHLVFVTLLKMQKQTKTHKSKQKHTKANKNTQKHQKTHKNKQKQTKTHKKTKSYQSAKPLITNETLFSIEQSVQAS